MKSISIVAASLLSLLNSSEAAPVETCPTQFGCLKFTVDQVSSPSCAGSTCDYKVCAEITNAPGCVKGADKWSHTCVKPGSGGVCTTKGFSGSINTGDIGVGHKECQIVQAGNSAEFVFKDGKTCGSPGNFPIGGLTASCAARSSTTSTCSGSGNVGKECIWTVPTPSVCTTTGGGGGDPHFRTYDGTIYSYHGECDLIMTRSPSFDNGLGLDVHTRTEIIANAWSQISDAAIRIGSDIFEISNRGKTYFNGVEVDGFPFMMADKYAVTKSIELVEGITKNEWNEEFSSETKQEERIFYTIDLSPRSDNISNDGSVNRISITIYRSMISVRVNAYMEDAEGMLGIHDIKGLVGRNHHSEFMNPNDMGSEWQVRNTDAKLFVNVGSVTYPEQCKLPSTSVSATSKARRLRSTVNEEQLERIQSACLIAPPDMYSLCVEDILRTGDLSLANAFAF